MSTPPPSEGTPAGPAPHLVIVGGGIAGLATAYYALQAAQQRSLPLRCTVFEAGKRFGGKLQTVRQDGWQMECGPDSLLTQKPFAIDLCRELGLGDQLIGSNDAHRGFTILQGGAFRATPGGCRLIAPRSRKAILTCPLFSPAGKLRILKEAWVPPRESDEDESIGDFVRRRFGSEFLDRFAGPLLAGISVGDPDRLSLPTLFPMLAAMERDHGSLTRAAQAAPPPVGSPAPLFTALRDGMESMVPPLVEAVERLGGELRSGAAVTTVRRQSDGFYVAPDIPGQLALRADAVVLAVPTPHAALVVGEDHPALARLLQQRRYVTSATVSLGFRTADLPSSPGLEGFGFLVARREDHPLLGLTVSSRKFSHRAPEGHTLLRIFIGGDGAEERAEQSPPELVAHARAALRDRLGLTAEPVVAVARTWSKGNPQYDVGHARWLASLVETLRGLPQLHLAGSAYHGISVSDCVKAAREQAPAIVDGLAKAR